MRKTLRVFLLMFVAGLMAQVVYAVPLKRRYGKSAMSTDDSIIKAMSISRASGLNKASAVKEILTTGDNKCVVILVKYSGSTTTKTTADFENILFSTAAVSMRSYYNEVSYGALTVTGTVRGWYEADELSSYYANNEGGVDVTYPYNSQGLVEEILADVDADIDFSKYDKDGDGYVDSVIFVFSGYFDPYGEDGTLMYPHKWELSTSAGGPGAVTCDGVQVNEYMIVPEFTSQGSPSTDICDVGILAHEFGHIIGLPDLYDTTGVSEGLGCFCLMARGAYGADGDSAEKPVHLSVWGKTYLNWLSPTTISSNGSRTLKNIEENAVAYKFIANPGFKGESEYFLIVNRQKKGFDSDLFGSGLLIYHIDETVSGLTAGIPNDVKAHKYVDLEEADGQDSLDRNDGYGDAGDFFITDRTFSNSSAVTPNSNTYASGKLDTARRIAFSVTGISSSGDDMIATYAVSNAGLIPAAGKSNIFTPNQDGYNDNVVFSEASGSYTIKIFDLAGRLVRQLDADDNEWNGKSFGKTVDSGIYIYQISNGDGTVTSGTVVVAK